MTQQLTDVFNNGDYLSGKIISRKIDYKAAGWRSVPAFISEGTFDAHVIVQVKEGRYRVTVDHMTITTAKDGTVPLDRYAMMENGTYKEFFFKNGSAIVIDYELDNLFDITKVIDTDPWQ